MAKTKGSKSSSTSKKGGRPHASPRKPGLGRGRGYSCGGRLHK